MQMKVREIEMILAEMGAIDPENPEQSLGENIKSNKFLRNTSCFTMRILMRYNSSTLPSSESESRSG